MHALIRKVGPELVSVYPATVARVQLGPMEYVSPSVPGWEDETFRIAEVEPAEIPDGKYVPDQSVAGVVLVDGVPTWVLADVLPPPIPDRVMSRQFFLQLADDGLLSAVEAWVDQQPLPIQIAFERSSTFVRDDADLQQGFTALGFSTEQVDAFFTAAAAR